MDGTQKDNWYLGCDIGGTFTDFVLCETNRRELRKFKLLTTPGDPSDGFLEGVRMLACDVDNLLPQTDAVMHATTLAINAIIERKGAPTALVTTAGFRDVLEIGREKRYDMHDIFQSFPEPLVPRRWRFEANERLYADGAVCTPLDLASVEALVPKLREEGITSVAICFLHAYANSDHERQTAEVLAKHLPDMALTLSSDLLAQVGEFERTCTTAANAYVKPIMRSYLKKVDDSLRDQDFDGRLFLTLSNGGLTSHHTARDYPIRVVESGPAAGAMGAEVIARRLGLKKVMAFDMGGTTAKICIIRDGELMRVNTFEVAREARFKSGSGIPLQVPVVDLLEIGAGGGSIAAANALGMLDVGPKSAGAEPGPACYGRGGTDVTVTDADVLLGYIAPAAFLGGRMSLDQGAAEAAMTVNVAKPLDMSAAEASWAVHELINENMAAAARVHFAEKGEDPEDFVMLAFGGAGPVHAAGLADKLGIREVVIPVSAGIFSALGFFTSPMMYDAVRAYRVELDDMDGSYMTEVIAALSKEVAAFLEVPDLSGVEWTASVDMRYVGQGYDISVPLAGDGPPDAADIAQRYDEAYVQMYGRTCIGVAREIINVRVSARREVLGIEALSFDTTGAQVTASHKNRQAYAPGLSAFTDFVVAQRNTLRTGTRIAAPCIIEETESTTVFPYAGFAEMDAEGNLRLHLEEDRT
jgi:N-methylhydantoinase A